MADQDFQINIRTLADLTGIKLTQQQLEALQTAAANGNKQAIAALKQLVAAQKEAATATNVGFSGTSVGVGTIVTLLTSALHMVNEFEKELDRMAEKMIEATAKHREQGLEIVELMRRMKESERIDTEPLEQSFSRLTQDVRRLKNEMNLAFETGAYEDVKKLNNQLSFTEGLLDKVTTALGRQTAEYNKKAAAAQKAAEAAARDAQGFLTSAVSTAQPQVQVALKNEEAARQARIAGREKEADLFQKSADQLKASMSQAQREEYEGLTKPVRLGPKAGPGESQEKLDEMARNQINFQRQLKGEPPLPEGAAQGNAELSTAIEQAFNKVMARYWGP